jgi:hypothetical protein
MKLVVDLPEIVEGAFAGYAKVDAPVAALFED